MNQQPKKSPPAVINVEMNVVHQPTKQRKQQLQPTLTRAAGAPTRRQVPSCNQPHSRELIDFSSRRQCLLDSPSGHLVTHTQKPSTTTTSSARNCFVDPNLKGNLAFIPQEMLELIEATLVGKQELNERDAEIAQRRERRTMQKEQTIREVEVRSHRYRLRHNKAFAGAMTRTLHSAMKLDDDK